MQLHVENDQKTMFEADNMEPHFFYQLVFDGIYIHLSRKKTVFFSFSLCRVVQFNADLEKLYKVLNEF